MMVYWWIWSISIHLWNKVIVGSQHSNNSTGAVYLSNIKNCNNILACNYNNGLLNDDSGCEFPINNYDCSGSCFTRLITVEFVMGKIWRVM